MKIDKFNESYRGDKIKKSYQNSILYKFKIEEEKIKEKLESKKKEILNLINEYAVINHDHFIKKYNFYPKYNKILDYDFGTYHDKPELILRQGSITVYLLYDDFEKLLKFLEDPDLYKNANKYNL